LHRDIKPENFLVDSGCGLKLIDFGMALRQGEQAGELVGTGAYIAPEVYNSLIYSHKSEVFAVGVILFEMISEDPHRSPFKEARLTDSNFLLVRQKLYDKFWGKVRSNPLDRQLRTILESMLSADPSERPSPTQILGYEYFKN
jgi:serine/threonine protein kinase